MKPKLVVLSAFMSPFRSGAEAMVEEVFPRLKDDFEITIITCRMQRGLGLGLGKGIKIVRVGFGYSLDKYLFPFFAPFAAMRIRPQIIHAVLESYAGAALVLCRFIVPKAVRILTLQSTNTAFLLGPIHRSAGKITAISRTLIERAKTLGRKDVTLIPNGIDLKSIREACRKFQKIPGRILFVGRLEQMKGVDTLLSAFARISDEFPRSHLRIVGDGSLRTSLESKARSLNLSGRVFFAGRITGPDLFREYAQAEVFCGLSRSEALGNVFLEARAAGCAVVGTRTGGIMEIIENGNTGLLVLPDDVSGAAGALHKLAAGHELLKTLAEQGKAGIEEYDWDRIALKYEQILKSI